jgi:3-hydroxy-9,10-secoandrosta-1,3,5(10)-triene-9,17-dione monooxygenase reductase component
MGEVLEAAADSDDSVTGGEDAVKAVTGDRFRAVLGHVPTSVAIVAGLVGGRPRGLSVGTFVPVSLEPPLVGFFVDKKSTSWPPISEVGAFAVSILAAEQADLSRQFAISNTDKFAGVPWHDAPSGHPVIEGSVAWVDCALDSVTDAGDHVFVMGRVIELDVETGGTPLLHHRGGYRRAHDLDP